MGQNSSKEEWSDYSSREFFARQVELYRWRADPLVNTHISRVSFQHQASLRDRERLRDVLKADQIPLNELMALAGDARGGEQLMSFEQYLCTLADLAERLTLQQVLYVLLAMFGGFETLLGKLGRCRADLLSCFVTKEGEVRVWLGPDYRSNQLQSQGQGLSPIISSEMSLIRRVLQLGQQLASNHTQFLHFTRQFRSYMERDILQNWNFANGRKLINSYLYTYRINLPLNIKDAALKAVKTNSNSVSQMSSVYDPPQSYPSQSQTSFAESKDEMQSTGNGFLRDADKSHPRKEAQQRPLSHSDYSNGKKSETAQHSLKLHSKKFSSTDLKNQGERGKGFQSPKMSRSQLLPSKLKEDERRSKQGMQYSSLQSQRLRRERQFAKVSERQQVKLYNFSTSVGFSPDTNSLIQGEDSNCQEFLNSSSLKQNQQAKQKKKLEKKVATISKYISYYQQESQASRQTDRIEQQTSSAHSNIIYFVPQAPLTTQQRQNQPLVTNNGSKSRGQLKMVHKLSYELKNIHAAKEYQKGRTQFNRSHGNSQHSNCSSQDNSYPRMCLTAKTLNKLLQNNQVSLHESNGSFMSMEHSEYSGALCKMGRSVNILNTPSGKEFNLQKKSNPSNAMNRSINC